MNMTGAIRVRVPPDLADRIQRAAGELGLDQSSFIRMTLTKTLPPARPTPEKSA